MRRHRGLGRISDKVGNLVCNNYRVLLLTGMALLMLVLSCRSSKYSNRQKVQVASKTQTDLNSALNKDNQFVRTTTLSDSIGQYYQLTIFPVDSFKFSLQSGFSGKATKVMILGSSKQLTRLSDSSKYAESLSAESAVKLTESVKAHMNDRSVSVERSTVLWKWLWISLAAIVLIIAVKLKFFKRRSWL